MTGGEASPDERNIDVWHVLHVHVQAIRTYHHRDNGCVQKEKQKIKPRGLTCDPLTLQKFAFPFKSDRPNCLTVRICSIWDYGP